MRVSFRSVRRLLGIMTAAVLLALPLAASAQSEPFNPNFSVTYLEDGVALDDQFEGAVTARLYAFDGTQGDVVTVSMTQAEGSNLDPFIVLIGPFGQVVGSDDDSGNLPLSSLISEVVLPQSGTYVVLASSYVYIDNVLEQSEAELAEIHPFTLTASGFTAPPEDETGYFASRLTLGDSGVQGYSTVEEPVYMYTYVAEGGETIDLVVDSAEDGMDTLLMVFGPGGDRLAVNDDDAQGGTTNSAIRGLTLTENDKYLFFATHVFFYNAGKADEALEYVPGSFTLSLSASAATK